MIKTASYLIGAGFSAPMGYPIGNKLNEQLTNCKGDNFGFHTSGKLIVNSDGTKPNFGYKTSYDISFEFCIALIEYFNKNHGYFDYEEFYDFIIEDSLKDEEVKKISQPFLGQFGDIEQLIFSLKNIYTQVVSFYIKDKDGKRWYDDEAYCLKPIFPGYTGFLNTFNKINEDSDSIYIHTLNHDLFFERLGNTEWLAGEICDGFEELGSPYFAPLKVKSRTYNCRLSRYTGKYDKKHKLYKLHGSFDYGVYYKSNGAMSIPEIYLKSRFGIGFSNLYKETKDDKGQLHYENCWFNYHADFLTGTTSKIERYNEPLLYKELFKIFKENLKKSDTLIIIGYGCKDKEINKIIHENFDHKKRQVFIIDPYPSETVKKFRDELNAKLIEKHLDVLSIKDL
jgi:NAD-dependent SIR2 family protein deacetylase